MTLAETTTDVRATINYFDPTLPRGRFDLVDPERNLMPLDPHEVTIRDLRSAPLGEVALDREGLQHATHSSRAVLDPELVDTNVAVQPGVPPVNAAYYDEMVPFIRALTGARDVIPQASGLTVRFSDRSKRKSWAGAAGFIHLDVTDESVRPFLDLSLQNAGRTIAPWSRFVLVQTWRAISAPPQDNLLALCDRTSVPPSDVVLYDAIIGDIGEGLDVIEARGCRYSPGHRWWYVSDMRADDLLVFTGYDSADPKGVQPFHTGFDLPGGEDATPRTSVEARFFAFYD
jgi:hypothetical protein